MDLISQGHIVFIFKPESHQTQHSADFFFFFFFTNTRLTLRSNTYLHTGKPEHLPKSALAGTDNKPALKQHKSFVSGEQLSRV